MILKFFFSFLANDLKKRFFLVRGHALEGNLYISTRLTPLRNSILCRLSHEILLKKRTRYIRGGGLDLTLNGETKMKKEVKKIEKSTNHSGP